ncbi:zinc finger BED domain-containing protein RICESLEEPER 2-like [Apium graveolens]|uniref:zinc finger BED domain-containing protein RICESLEEPER 2-like n=1 Tax=Apium graveolens TaxID=4045 RepID=UPI003D7B0331
MPPPHSGLMISDTIFACLNDWGIENKITTITLDNASSNDTANRHLKDAFTLKGNLYIGGKNFHVRCCAHVLNLMVQDGLSVIGSFISNVRDSVKYLKSSSGRLHKFYDIAKHLQLNTSKKLMLDVSTRWNSTYVMLKAAIAYKDVFPRYKERDPYYQCLPSYEDWEKATKVMQFLEVFDEATTVFSGYEYPTSNVFLPEIWKIKELLLLTSVNDSRYMREMTLKMKDKFEKYWGECNLIMSIAYVLDLRYKLQLAIFCFPKIYLTEYEANRNVEMVKRCLYELYEHYVKNLVGQKFGGSNGSNNEASSSKVVSSGTNVTKSRAEFDDWAQGFDQISPQKSELDVYLEEGRYICKPGETFDALQWWKSNAIKWRVLSQLAKDILSIPVSTVASEYTFSAGGRVLDQYRSSLKPDTVQALICTSDWLRAEYKLSSTFNSCGALEYDEEGDPADALE